ncbi:MAG: gluconeogenesis factor YvcK family protein [Patescibacteria group bacterium]
MKKRKKIVVIGGGTGTFVALTGLKRHPYDLTAIVTMMDSGGSSGRLRDELGVLPPGDIRQCIVALSTSTRLLRKMFNYRFEEGGLTGHTFGNIFLSTLEKSTGSIKKAIEEVGKILRIQGEVVPVTFDKTELCVELADGRIIKGETHIDVVEGVEKRARIKDAFLTPKVSANPDAVSAILNADFVLIGPGDLYTSIIPNLLVKGIKEALSKTSGKVVFVLNLMTKHGQTTDYSAKEHLSDLQKYIGDKTIDYILVNSKKPNNKALVWYEEYGEEPVKDDLPTKKNIIRRDLISSFILGQNPGDELKRSIIRHSPKKLADEVNSLVS